MYEARIAPELILQKTPIVLERPSDGFLAVLDELPAPIYVTDAAGDITYFNPASIDFAGHSPTLGKEPWCVSWKLYTDEGDFLPQDQCSMAETILKKRAIRGVTAIAERPDGTRVNFLPFPTPLLGKNG